MRAEGALSAAARRARSAVLAALAVVLLAGTAFGDDDHFPFGPFRMYSTTNELDGTVNSVRFEAADADGETFAPRPQDFGLRPAEINGQIGRFRADPSLLGRLAESYVRVHPDAAPITRLTLGYGIWTLEDGRPVAFREEPVVTWTSGA